MAVLLNEPERPAVLRATRGALLAASPTLPWEVGNALIALHRRRRIDEHEVQLAWAAYQKVAVPFGAVDVAEALRLAVAQGVYAYDAYVLEAARSERAPLAALDRRLKRAAKACGIEVLEITP